MEEFLIYLLKKIVDNPDQIFIEKIDSDGQLNLTVKLHQHDISQVIGKNGKTIQALKLLLYAYLSKKDIYIKKIYINIKEN
jgi:predicted RNA-binding protein YlqC (UPF0109 family)